MEGYKGKYQNLTNCHLPDKKVLIRFIHQKSKAVPPQQAMDKSKRLEIYRKRDLQSHHQAYLRGQVMARTGLIFVP